LTGGDNIWCQKKAKVGNGMVDDGAGQENNMSIVSHLHDPTLPLTDMPATAAQCQPQPTVRCTGAKDVEMNM
jgi:hypothetical protein